MRRRCLLPLAALLLLLTACETAVEPSPAVTDRPEPSTAPAVQVQTDWSKLTPREPVEEVYERWYEEYREELLPWEDYGTLIPFAGARLDGEWAAGYLYGLMTMDGKVVVDPVYSEVYAMNYYELATGETGTFPGYVLVQPTGELDEYGNPRAKYAYAGRNGSWCTAFSDDVMYSAGPDYLLYREAEQWYLRDQAGALVRSYTAGELGLEGQPWVNIEWCADKAGIQSDGTEGSGEMLVIDGRTGEVEQWTKIQWEEWQNGFSNWSTWVVQAEDGRTILRRGEEEYTLPYQDPNEYEPSVAGELVVFWSDYGQSGPVYRLDGTELVPPGRYQFVGFFWDQLLTQGGSCPLYGIDEAGNTVVMDQNGQEVFLIPAETLYTSGPWDGILGVLGEDMVTYYDLSTGACVLRISLYGEGE